MKNTIISLFLIMGLSDAWSDISTSEILQNAQKSVFLIKKDGVGLGTGFMVEDGNLVTSFRVYEALIKSDLSSISIQNTDNQEFQIESLRGINLLAGLALFKVKDYNGASLELVGLLGRGGERNFSLLGFPKEKFTIIDLVRGPNTSSYHQFFGVYNEISFSIVGAPIVNSEGKVVAVFFDSANSTFLGIKNERIEDFLNMTRNQTIIGTGIVRDFIEGELNNLKRLGEQGDAEAQYLVGQSYVNSKFVEEKERWFRMAAEQNHSEAQFGLAWALLMSEGGGHKVVRWFTLAAEQGHTDAQYNLGWLSFKANLYNDAVFWFFHAANQGHADSQYGAGMTLSAMGLYDYAKHWYGEAAKQGHIAAQNALYEMAVVDEQSE